MKLVLEPTESTKEKVVASDINSSRGENPARRLFGFLLTVVAISGLIVFLSAVTQHWSKKRRIPFANEEESNGEARGALKTTINAPESGGATTKGTTLSRSSDNKILMPDPHQQSPTAASSGILAKESPKSKRITTNEKDHETPYPSKVSSSWPQWAIDFLIQEERTLSFTLLGSTNTTTGGREDKFSWFKCLKQEREYLGEVASRCSSSPSGGDTEVAQGLKSKFETRFQPNGARNTCFDNTNCSINQGCFMTEDGKCFSSPVEAIRTNPSPDSIKSSPLILDFQPEVQFDKERLDGQPWRSAPSGGDMEMKDELSCAWQPERPVFGKGAGKEVAEPDLSDTSPENVLKVFKYFTGGFFEKGYDWQADIKKTVGKDDDTGDVDGDFSYTGGHDHRSDGSVFRLQNFCLTGLGSMYGWNPRDLPSIRENPSWFSSYDENTPFISLAHEEHEVFPILRPWLQEPKLLKEKPSWYVDRKLHLMTTTRWHAHAAWALSSMGNIIWNVESAFPRKRGTNTEKEKKEESEEAITNLQKAKRKKSNKGSRVDWEDPQLNYAREDVTTAFIGLPVVENLNFALPCHKNKTCGFNPYWKPFLTTATTTHFFVPHHQTNGIQAFVEHARDGLKKGKVGKSKAFRQELKQFLEAHPVCFKEAVVYGSCYKGNCLNIQPKDSPAQWPIQGYRNPRVQNLIARRFRACAAVEKSLGGRTEPNRTAPTIFVPIRTAYHRGKFRNSETLPIRLLRMAKEAGYDAHNVRLIIGEMNTMTTIQHVAYYSIADVIFGTFGSAFLWGFLMPPGGSVGLEFRALDTAGAGVKIGGWVWRYGVDWPISLGINRNIWTDYGSMWRAQGGHQILVPFKKRYLYPDTTAVVQPDYTFDYPEPALRSAFVDGALCVLKNGAAAAKEVTEENFSKRGNSAKEIQGKEAMTELRESLCPAVEEAKAVDPGPEPPQHEIANDWKTAAGSYLKRLIRSKMEEEMIPHAPRLVALLRAAPKIADLMAKWKPSSSSKSSAASTLLPPALSIFPCEQSTPTKTKKKLQKAAHAHQIELDVLHSYFSGSSATLFTPTTEGRQKLANNSHGSSPECRPWLDHPLKAPYGRLVRVKLKNGHHGRSYQDADSRIGMLTAAAASETDAAAAKVSELLPSREVEENLWGVQAHIHFKSFDQSTHSDLEFSFVLIDSELWAQQVPGTKKWIRSVVRGRERIFLLASNGTFSVAPPRD